MYNKSEDKSEFIEIKVIYKRNENNRYLLFDFVRENPFINCL